VVVLDGRSVVRTVFPVTEAVATDEGALQERSRWELEQRLGKDDVEVLHIECSVRGRRGDWLLADAWGAYPETLRRYDEVVQGTGCHVSRWECDAWALHRLYEWFVPAAQRDALTAGVHLEAESMEVILADAAGSMGLTLPRAESAGAFVRSWDPDDLEGVAREVAWSVGQLSDRWIAGSRPDQVEVARLLVTGSIDEPDRLVGAFTRAMPLRVELLDLRTLFEVADEVADSPLVQGNLGAFSLAAGGALSQILQ
jgi:hypothetical protein